MRFSYICPNGGMADAVDLKSNVRYGRESSSLSWGTDGVVA